MVEGAGAGRSILMKLDFNEWISIIIQPRHEKTSL